MVEEALKAALKDFTAMRAAEGANLKADVLGKLDTRAALQRFNGPQLHLFAGLDALVPVQAASDVLALLPDVEVGLIEQACHAFLLEAPHELAAAIQAFLHESGDE